LKNLLRAYAKLVQKRKGSGDIMKYLAIFNILQMVYGQILRPLLMKAINDPNEEWDDVVLAMVDRLFDYTP